MLRPVIAFESFGDFLAWTLHTLVTQLSKRDRIPFALENGIQNSLAADPGDIAQNVMDLDVHLAERLLHVHDVLGSHLQQTTAMTPQRPDGADFIRRTKTPSQQPD